MDNESEKTVNPGTENQEPEGKETDKAVSAKELEARIKQLEAENGKLRQANTNASADASKWKKQYQEMLPEKERLEKEQEEQNAALRNELETLKAERNVAKHKSELLSIGFEDELAQEVAEAINAGETVKMFEGLRRFIAAHDKQLRENAFRTNPTLQGGGTVAKAYTKEQFDKMGYKERVKVFEEYPELYSEFTKQ